MIRAGTGLSTVADPVRAAIEAGEQAARGLRGSAADWCIAFVASEHLPRLKSVLNALSERTGTPYIVGCSASGVLANGIEVETGPVLGVLAVAADRIRTTTFLFADDGDQGLSAGVNVAQRLVSSKGSADLILVWPDPYRIRPQLLLQGMEAGLGPAAVAGAASSSRFADGSTVQFSGGESERGAVSGVRLGGEYRYFTGVTQGCRPVGDPLTVTRAHGHLILEIEERAALDVLRERLPGSVADPVEPGSVFVGLWGGSANGEAGAGDYLVRNLLAMDNDTGVLAVGDVVEDGQQLVFAVREPRAARDDLGRMAERARAAAGERGFAFGLYFNCLARGRSLYGEGGVDVSILARELPGLPLLGMFGNAEIAPVHGTSRVFMHTGVLVLVGDEE